MQITFTCSMAGNPGYTIGQTYDVADADEAQRFVDAGFATAETDDPTEAAVADEFVQTGDDPFVVEKADEPPAPEVSHVAEHAAPDAEE